MQRRTLLKSLPAVAVPLGLAGCSGDGMPDKECEGHCQLLEEWSWDWESNGALNPDTLTLTFVPMESSPPLQIEFRGYNENSNLAYAGTYTIEGAETIIEENVDSVTAAKIEVTAVNES